jgi:hypothetical protein
MILHGVIAGCESAPVSKTVRGWLFPDKMEVRAHDGKPGPSI